MLMQLSSGREPSWTSPLEGSNAFLNWQLLYSSQGNRELLSSQELGAGASPVGSAFLVLTVLLLGVCACACAFSAVGTANPAASLPGGPSTRPTLEPRGRPSQLPTQPPTMEDTGDAMHRFYCSQSICCPDLVVPRYSQSLLGVPRLVAEQGSSEALLDIVDPIGMPLLKAEVNLSTESARLSQREPTVEKIYQAREPLIVLRNLKPEARGSLLRSPKRGFVDTSALAVAYKYGRELEICLPDNSIFASLAKVESHVGPRFVLKIGAEEVTGWIFQGCQVEEQLAVTDAKKKILAQTQVAQLSFESERSFYSVQANSGMDVGVLICCLIYMDGLSQGVF